MAHKTKKSATITNIELDTTGNEKRGKPKRVWREGIRISTSERNLNEEDGMNRKEWKLDSGQCRKAF